MFDENLNFSKDKRVSLITTTWSARSRKQNTPRTEPSQKGLQLRFQKSERSKRNTSACYQAVTCAPKPDLLPSWVLLKIAEHLSVHRHQARINAQSGSDLKWEPAQLTAFECSTRINHTNRIDELQSARCTAQYHEAWLLWEALTSEPSPAEPRDIWISIRLERERERPMVGSYRICTPVFIFNHSVNMIYAMLRSAALASSSLERASTLFILLH